MYMISIKYVKVEHCVSDLVKLKEELGSAAQELKGLISETEDGQTMYKGHQLSKFPQSDIPSACNKFIDSLVENIESRLAKF